MKDDHITAAAWAMDGIADAFGVDGITDRLLMVSHDPLVKQGCCTAGDGIHHGRDVVREGPTNRVIVLYVRTPELVKEIV